MNNEEAEAALEKHGWHRVEDKDYRLYANFPGWLGNVSTIWDNGNNDMSIGHDECSNGIVIYKLINDTYTIVGSKQRIMMTDVESLSRLLDKYELLEN
jgi:hypothetical protein